MPATASSLRTYLGIDPASVHDEEAMGAAVAAANDLVTHLRPDLVFAPVKRVNGYWAYRSQAPPPGAGEMRADAGVLYLSKTDDDGYDRTADLAAVVVTTLVLTWSGTAHSFKVTTAADLGGHWSLQGTWAAGPPPTQAERVLIEWVAEGVFLDEWPARADQAAIVEAARLYGRRGSVQGIAAFADIGVSLLPRLDPEVRSLLELGEYQRSVVA